MCLFYFLQISLTVPFLIIFMKYISGTNNSLSKNVTMQYVLSLFLTKIFQTQMGYEKRIRAQMIYSGVYFYLQFLFGKIFFL